MRTAKSLGAALAVCLAATTYVALGAVCIQAGPAASIGFLGLTLMIGVVYATVRG